MIPSISAACFSKGIWIRVTGRGCFECSASLKAYVKMMIEKGHHDYVIDLIACDQIDSTFMGTIAGIAQRLRKELTGTLRVINVSEKNQQLMESLGLDQLFLIQSLSLGAESPPTLDNPDFCGTPTICQNNEKLIQREILISAHKTLISLHGANAAKFQNIFELVS